MNILTPRALGQLNRFTIIGMEYADGFVTIDTDGGVFHIDVNTGAMSFVSQAVLDHHREHA